MENKIMRPVTPLLAVDMVVLTNQGIVLVKRKNPPLGWALPGGFVNVGESVRQAAIREAKEETGLDITSVGIEGVYSDPDRDPRGHTVSIVFSACANGMPKGADDALEARAFHPDELPSPLCFDHEEIITDCLGRMLEEMEDE